MRRIIKSSTNDDQSKLDEAYYFHFKKIIITYYIKQPASANKSKTCVLRFRDDTTEIFALGASFNVMDMDETSGYFAVTEVFEDIFLQFPAGKPNIEWDLEDAGMQEKTIYLYLDYDILRK